MEDSFSVPSAIQKVTELWPHSKINDFKDTELTLLPMPQHRECMKVRHNMSWNLS